MSNLKTGVKYVFKDTQAREDFVSAHHENKKIAVLLDHGFYIKEVLSSNCYVRATVDKYGADIHPAGNWVCILHNEQKYFAPAESLTPKQEPDVTLAKTSLQAFDEAVKEVRQFNSELFTTNVEDFVRLVAFAIKLKS